MKEKKIFFGNNRLNKGYKAINNIAAQDSTILQSQYKNILPPIDVLAQYEESYPGTLDKICAITHKEQDHKYNTDLAKIQSSKFIIKLCGALALIAVMLILLSSIFLWNYVDNSLVASVFCLSAFAFMGLILLNMYRPYVIKRHNTRTYRSDNVRRPYKSHKPYKQYIAKGQN